ESHAVAHGERCSMAPRPDQQSGRTDLAMMSLRVIGERATGIPARYGAGRSDQRPGIAMATVVAGKPTSLRHGARPLQQCRLLGGIDERGQRWWHTGFDETANVGEQTGGNRLTAKVPDDGAQLRLGVERQGVVDRVHAAIGTEQTVTRLAIGVVGDEVEEADALKTLGMRGVLAKREVVLSEVRFHEQLVGAFTVGPVALDRQRDQAPLE